MTIPDIRPSSSFLLRRKLYLVHTSFVEIFSFIHKRKLKCVCDITSMMRLCVITRIVHTMAANITWIYTQNTDKEKRLALAATTGNNDLQVPKGSVVYLVRHPLDKDRFYASSKPYQGAPWPLCGDRIVYVCFDQTSGSWKHSPDVRDFVSKSRSALAA